MRSLFISLLCAASLLPGCALPPRLTFTPDEQAAIYQLNSSDPQIVAEGRRNLIALHPEWPQEVRDAASHSEILPVQQVDARHAATAPDPPYSDFQAGFAWPVKAMTRTQTIAAWGYPSSRRAGGLNPPLTEEWLYKDVTPTITVRFHADVMTSDPDYQGNYERWPGRWKWQVPKGKFGFRKQSVSPSRQSP